MRSCFLTCQRSQNFRYHEASPGFESLPFGVYSRPRTSPRFRRAAFTLVEVMIAIGILAMVLTAIYSSWTAILRASKVGLSAAASVQRARIAVRTLEESLSSTECFVAHMQRHPEYYAFAAENGSEASLSFVARLAKSFPRSGKFGDLDLRRVTFSVEAGPDNGRRLVLRQQPILMELDKDEKEHPLVLAKNVQEFQLQFFDQRLNDWIDEWTQTNQIPKLVMVTLKLADNANSTKAQEEITRLINIPAMAVQPLWQVPMMPRGPAGSPPPSGGQNSAQGSQGNQGTGSGFRVQ